MPLSLRQHGSRLFYLLFDSSLAERKIEQQNEDEAPQPYWIPLAHWIEML
jgi:hypothetical protein